MLGFPTLKRSELITIFCEYHLRQNLSFDTDTIHISFPEERISVVPARCSNRLPTMSTATSSIRQRGGQPAKKPATASTGTREDEPNGILDTKKENSSVSSEWDYKLALAIITILAFVTRFWGIGHPNEVVFDEVHFGKVC